MTTADWRSRERDRRPPHTFGAAQPRRHDPQGIHAKLTWPARPSPRRSNHYRAFAGAPAFNEYRVIMIDAEGEHVNADETRRARTAAKAERRARREASR